MTLTLVSVTDTTSALVPLNKTETLFKSVPKLVPLIVISSSFAPELALRLVILGPGIKVKTPVASFV